MWTLDVNYLAVVVAAIVPMALGAVWYSPVLFSNAWLAAIGKTADEISAQANQVQAFSIAIAASLISAYVLAILAALSGASSILDGIILGLWAVVFIATASATWGRIRGPAAASVAHQQRLLPGRASDHGRYHRRLALTPRHTPLGTMMAGRSFTARLRAALSRARGVVAQGAAEAYREGGRYAVYGSNPRAGLVRAHRTGGRLSQRDERDYRRRPE